MDGMRIVVPITFGGMASNSQMAADAQFYWTTPCALTLVHASLVASNAADTTVSIGTSSDADGYLTATAVGQSEVPTVKDRGDFDGALNSDTAECPHIAAGTVLEVAVDYDGAGGTAGQDVCVVLTFLEG
jgi:hypothetical protein